MIENNKNTTMAMDKIYFEDPTGLEDYLFDSTEYAMELDNRNPVLEGIVERLIQLGIQITCEDKKVITKELNNRYIASETVMEDNAFSYCEDLTDVIIGVGNTEIGTYSFYDCTSLENVSIAADSEDDSPSFVIDDKAFQSCSVQNVVIGRGNVELGDNAFSYCENLVSVDIKGVLSDIGDYAFYECPAELVISYNGGSYNKESIEDVK